MKTEKNLIDDLSSEIHDIWIHWMKYMLPKVKVKSASDELMWKKQMKTKFKNLSDIEKQSDIEQATKILSVLVKYIKKISETTR